MSEGARPGSSPPTRAAIAVASVSLANLLLLRLWFELNHLQHFPLYQYYLQRAAGPVDYAAALVTATLLAALAYPLLRAASGAHGRIATGIGSVLFAAALTICLALAVDTGELLPELALWRLGDRVALALDSHWLVPLLAACALLIALAAPLARAAVVCARLALIVVLLLAPFGTLMMGHAIGNGLRPFWAERDAAPAAGEPAPVSANRNGAAQRGVLLVFDEFDYRLALEQPPDDLALPAFERLRARGVEALNAYPPSNATVISMPAMLGGRMVAGIRPWGWTGLDVDYAGGGTQAFPAGETLIERLDAAGVTSAIAGWYLPYCRIFPAIKDCVQVSAYGFATSIAAQTGFGGALATQWRQALPWTLGYAGMRQARLMTALERMLDDARHGLVFAHLPVPHFPYLPAAGTRAETTYPVPEGPQNYFSNLREADAALARVLERLEARCAGCLLVVTSDHWWRWSRRHDGRTDRRVPFIAAIIGRDEPVRLRRPISNIAVHDLLLAAAREGFASHAALAAWLERNAPMHDPVMASWMTDPDRAAH